MVVNLAQPVLPAEAAWSDAELDFMENSPPGLFPENQNSNFGLVRKIWTDRIQELISQQMTIYSERFVDTANSFIDEWERSVGLPVNPANRTLVQRRQDVLGRLARGAFTRSRRREIVEKFILATIGDPIQFTPTGVPFDSTGIPFFSEGGDLSTLYTISEDIPNFSYSVDIIDTVDVDVAGLTRELDRITTAGISFTIGSAAEVGGNPQLPGFFYSTGG